MARKVKSLAQGRRKNIPGYVHREHRSKKGRKKAPPRSARIEIWKDKKKKLISKEMKEIIATCK